MDSGEHPQLGESSGRLLDPRAMLSAGDQQFPEHVPIKLHEQGTIDPLLLERLRGKASERASESATQ